MKTDVLAVTEQKAVVYCQGYQFTIRLDAPPSIIDERGGRYYESPPKAVATAAYRRGYAILRSNKRRKEKKEQKKTVQEGLWSADLFNR